MFMPSISGVNSMSNFANVHIHIICTYVPDIYNNRRLSARALKSMLCLIFSRSRYKGSSVTLMVPVSGHFYKNNLTNRKPASTLPSPPQTHTHSGGLLAASIPSAGSQFCHSWCSCCYSWVCSLAHLCFGHFFCCLSNLLHFTLWTGIEYNI
jgi:hypothetical protein